ncbi:hypothetical protein C3B55_00434 [Candidatus Pseudomonas adelgestsugas]|uniref:Uncharacterized protein n=1 Tax=Candidatus Pseudomonas adelgestsugas TaxID=1302376 RepID=A0ABX5R803_9PSED|nr:hypothetical protein C3B55_00434 [Candidatus Pseudomonas adelgestsugas]
MTEQTISCLSRSGNKVKGCLHSNPFLIELNTTSVFIMHIEYRKNLTLITTVNIILPIETCDASHPTNINNNFYACKAIGFQQTTYPTNIPNYHIRILIALIKQIVKLTTAKARFFI